MNKKENKKGCHPRVFLSGISLIGYINKGKSLWINNKKAGDSRQQPSGMTALFDNGFTLIELLVVVLIIGILAAIALPQYQVTIYKTRLQKLMPLMRAMREAENEYKLANGSYTLDFDSLSIKLPPGDTCSGGSAVYGNYYASCVDYGDAFCAINTSETDGAVVCGVKDPLIYLTHPFRGHYWACWSSSAGSLSDKVCKSITGVARLENGAHVFPYL